MSFILITGPMKSGKSLELISMLAPYEIARQKVVLVHPTKNIRDDQVTSRLGVTKTSRKVDSLTQVKDSFDVIGIDEVHMFPLADMKKIKEWVLSDKVVIASGLDTTYKGSLMPMLVKLLELRPDTVIHKHSVCELCHNFQGAYTQILRKGLVVKRALPPSIPEDPGSSELVFRTVCRSCFFANDN